ncbi:hypothetical protein BsWGS_28577 [Bradybaena similaris]
MRATTHCLFTDARRRDAKTLRDRTDSSETRKSSAGDGVTTYFRQAQAKQEVMEMRREYSTIKIQAGVRGFLCRQRLRRIRNEETFKSN